MTLSPKHLSLDEMWQLYNLLKSGLKDQKEYLMDELIELMGKISQEEYLKSISLMYDNKIQYDKLSPVDSVILFSDGLSFNKFFDFCDFIGKVNGHSS